MTENEKICADYFTRNWPHRELQSVKIHPTHPCTAVIKYKDDIGLDFTNVDLRIAKI